MCQESSFPKDRTILAEVWLISTQGLRLEFVLTDAIGGAANIHTPTENEEREIRAHNEKVRSSFNRSGSEERSSIRALADKAKNTLAGKHHDGN